jgi:hypothetical protein
VSSSKDRLAQAASDWKAGRMKLPDADDAEFIPLHPAAGRAGAARAGHVVSGPMTEDGRLTMDMRGEPNLAIGKANVYSVTVLSRPLAASSSRGSNGGWSR